MRVPEWLKLTARGPEKVLYKDGTRLRLLAAQEVLEARREAWELAGQEKERALCSNACLVARAVVDRRGKPVYRDGRDVLDRCTPGQIQELARMWAEFDREDGLDFSIGRDRVERLKKGWSACRGSACGGVCSGVLGRCRRRNGRRP